MAGWQDLPPELCQKCVKSMTLMSRQSLRICSRRDRANVDAVPMVVPRVIVSDATGKTEVRVLAGIRDDVRVVFGRDENGGIWVERRSSSHVFKNVRKALQIAEKSKSQNPEDVAIDFLTWIFSNKLTKLQTLEIDHLNLDFTDKCEKLMRPQKTIEFAKFMDFRNEPFWDVLDRIGIFAPPIYPESYQFAVQIDRNFKCSDVPTVIVETAEGGRKHTTYLFNQKFGEHGNFLQELLSLLLTFSERLAPESCTSVAFPMISREKAQEIIEKVPGVLEDVSTTTIKRYHPLPDKLIRFTLSPCGFWVETMTSTPSIPEKPTVACGMGVACQKHTAPFDYWHYQQLPSRLEPVYKAYLEEAKLKLAHDKGNRYFDSQTKKIIGLSVIILICSVLIYYLMI